MRSPHSEPLLEIRTYRLKPGTVGEFHRVVTEQCVPLLRRAGITVVKFGPSEQEEDGATDYVLLRAFPSGTLRDEQENLFYGSRAWRDGPRADVLARIESYHTVVLTFPAAALTALGEDATPAARPQRGEP